MARGSPLTTEYSYNNLGEMTGVDYSDSTPDVTMTYTRFGRLDTVDDFVGTRTFDYRDEGDSGTYRDLQLVEEAINSGGGGLYGKTITRGYGISGITNLSISADNYSVHYDYDSKGRLDYVSGPGIDFTGNMWSSGVHYARMTNSELIGTVEYKVGSTVKAKTTKVYETDRNVLDYVHNEHYISSLTDLSTYDYSNDWLGRRWRVEVDQSRYSPLPADSWTVDYGYNDRSELVSADRTAGYAYTPPDPRVLAGDYDFNYDNIGNRTSYTLDSSTVNYTTNDLNQYDIPLVNPDHDTDGNLLADGVYGYSWDAENRLIAIVPPNPSNGDTRIEFSYDYMGRRVEKRVYEYDVVCNKS